MQNKTEKFLRHIVMLIQVGFISKRQRRRLHYLYDYIVECLENSQRVACKIRKNTGQPALREYSLACFCYRECKREKHVRRFHIGMCAAGVCGGRTQALACDSARIWKRKFSRKATSIVYMELLCRIVAQEVMQCHTRFVRFFVCSISPC